MKKEDIDKYLAAKSYDELVSATPRSTEGLGCSLTAPGTVELAPVPTDIMSLVLARRNVPKQRSREELVRLASNILRSYGIRNVAVKVDSDLEGNTGSHSWDAEIRQHKTRNGWLIHLHPSLLWAPEDYVREVIEHEILHTKEEKEIQ